MNFIEELRKQYGLPNSDVGVEKRNGSIFKPSSVFAPIIDPSQGATRPATPAEIQQALVKYPKLPSESAD